MRTTSKLVLALGASAAFALSGCGGGGGDASMPAAATADSVPASAAASTQSFTDYAKGLKPADVVEPLKLQQLLPPISDTTEPFAVGG